MDIGKEMVSVTHLIKRDVDRTMIKHGLSISQSRILMHIFEHGGNAYQRDLEDVVHLRRSTITAHLQLLEKDGLIERKNVDAKQKRLILTEKGMDKVQEIQGIFVENERRLREILADDNDEFLKLLFKLKSALTKEEIDD